MSAQRYSWATLSSGDISKEIWFSRLGAGRTADNPPRKNFKLENLISPTASEGLFL